MATHVTNPPDASALMTSARSLGNYDLARALADLLDNSITAGTKSIDITCTYGAGNPEIRVRDDGRGMSAEELRIAMRPASVNPDAERSADDLGRFGWGMKSASFSQCKLLTVVTKKQGSYSAASWDLEKIDGWSMASYSGSEAEELLEESIPGSAGTELIWQKCDRLSEGNSLTQDQFNEIIAHARGRLSLLFHRYISGKSGARKISISLNGTPLDAFDPFHSDHPATQAFPAEAIPVTVGTKVIMKAYTLPHYTKLEQDEYETLGGEEGYVKNQGFYVYRNNRLIIYGTWFRLAKHGELSKLVRISIDIPNTLDSMWKVTIDKSDVQLPFRLRERMKTLVNRFRDKSTQVFKSKGGKISSGTTMSVWERYAKNQQIEYRLNRSHPLLKALGGALDAERRSRLGHVLKLIEQEIPIDSVFSDATTHPQKLRQAVTDPDKFREFVRATVPILLADGTSITDVVEQLRVTEPYVSQWPVVESYLIERGLIWAKT